MLIAAKIEQASILFGESYFSSLLRIKLYEKNPVICDIS
jgi:hypothetical protein